MTWKSNFLIYSKTIVQHQLYQLKTVRVLLIDICEGADEFKHLSDFSILSSDYVIHPSNLTMFAVQMQFFPHSAVMYLETQHGFS